MQSKDFLLTHPVHLMPQVYYVCQVPTTINMDEPLPVDFYGVEDFYTVDFDKFSVLLGE